MKMGDRTEGEAGGRCWQGGASELRCICTGSSHLALQSAWLGSLEGEFLYHHVCLGFMLSISKLRFFFKA